MKLKIVVLMWIDIQTHPGWQPEESEFTIMPSVGFLKKKGRKEIQIASTYDPDGKTWGDVMKYPASVVKEIRVVGEVEV